MSSQLTQMEKAMIIFLYDNNKSMNSIAEELKVNIKTVSLWLKRYNETQSVDINEKRGRHYKTTENENLQIIDVAKKMERCVTINKIRIEISEIGINLSNNTIIDRLKNCGYHYSYPIKKPFMSEEHKRKILEFAINNYNTDWFSVIFADETTIVKDGNFDRKIWIGQEVDNVVRKLRHNIKRNLYGCIFIGGLETFKIFKENMNADKYIDILDETLILIYDNRYLYQQYNSPIHKSKKAQKYFSDNGIKLLKNWPPNSPDLNPIENLWFLLKYKLINEKINSTNFNEIIEKKIKEIKYEHIFNMISSMQIRIYDVIQNNGDYINY